MASIGARQSADGDRPLLVNSVRPIQLTTAFSVGLRPADIKLSCVNLDLSALPVDIDALHQLVRGLAAQVADDDAQLVAAHAEVERLRLIIRRLQAQRVWTTVGKPPMTTSLRSVWKTSRPIFRGQRLLSHHR